MTLIMDCALERRLNYLVVNSRPADGWIPSSYRCCLWLKTFSPTVLRHYGVRRPFNRIVTVTDIFSPVTIVTTNGGLVRL